MQPALAERHPLCSTGMAAAEDFRRVAMMRYTKMGLCLAALVSLAISASAQSRVAARPAVRPMPTVRSSGFARGSLATHAIVIRVPATRAPRRVTAANSQSFSSPGISLFPNSGNGFILSGATSFDLGQLLNNVPGLGFDYEFLDAMNQNLGERAFIDPVTQQDLALAQRLSQTGSGFAGFVPFFGGGYYAEPAEEQQQPPVVIEQQPQTAPASESESESSTAPVEAPAPLPDVGEFVLVLQNGDKIKAVAFTRQSDQIVYITKDGVRQSFPAADLDAARTQQINQQRGTPLQLSL
jgi:hypothetical protein